MEWNELSNAEIEVSLKEMEFEYDSIATNIQKQYDQLYVLNNKYLEGKKILDKRLKNMK